MEISFEQRSPYFHVFPWSACRLRRLACLVPLIASLLVMPVLACGQNNQTVSKQIDTGTNVVLFTGSIRANPFWQLFTDFMNEVARDLNLKVEVKYANGSRASMKKQIREVCQRTEKPDAILIHSFKRTGPEVLRIADQYDVPIFLANSGLNETEKIAIGAPRTKLKNWIGEMLPDDKDAGQQLAVALIQEAKRDPARIGPDGKIHVLAINGNASHSASIEREKGLRAAINEMQDVVLDQIVTVDWEREFARKRCQFLLRRYPHVAVIWSASDLMALGAIEAVRNQGLVPGKDIIIGGVDATPEALKLIDEGSQFATVGGHFKEGGWVAVLLHDYLRGSDFADFGTQFDSKMTLIVKENLDAYRTKVTRATWERTDFTKFSRYYDKELTEYPFDVQVRTVDTPSRPGIPKPLDTSILDPRRSE